MVCAAMAQGWDEGPQSQELLTVTIFFERTSQYPLEGSTAFLEATGLNPL
jgi:hypothetical protein